MFWIGRTIRSGYPAFGNLIPLALLALSMQASPAAATALREHGASGEAVTVATIEDGSDEQSARAKYDELSGEYRSKIRSIGEAFENAKDDRDREIAGGRQERLDAEFSAGFLHLGDESGAGKVALDCYGSVVQLGGRGPEAQAAIGRLRRDFARSSGMAEFCRDIGVSPCEAAESLLRDLLRDNTDRTTQARAGLAGWAKRLGWWAELPEQCDQDPARAKQLVAKYGAETIDRLRVRDRQAMIRESIALAEAIEGKYPDVKLFDGDAADGVTVGGSAGAWLSQRRDLAVGKPAPPAEGDDARGKFMRLADYRGKVVVLVFWASWCGPCMEQVPDERELNRKMAGRPFTLIGVNCDYTPGAARTAIEKNEMGWPQWYDGPEARGRIAQAYRIQSIPQVFVIDARGVIRFKSLHGPALERAVDGLLREIGG